MGVLPLVAVKTRYVHSEDAKLRNATKALDVRYCMKWMRDEAPEAVASEDGKVSEPGLRVRDAVGKIVCSVY